MNHSFGTKQRNGNWKTLNPLQAKNPLWNPVRIGNSIWISSKYNDGEKGMIEFSCNSGKIKQIVRYPYGFRPEYHFICNSDGNDIMIIDGHNGNMRSFNVMNKKYGAEIGINKSGLDVSSIMIRGYMHILHGWNDMNSKYLVYSMTNGTVSEFKGNHQPPKTYGVAITKGPDNTFYKFGGYDNVNEKFLDSFYVGKLQNNDPSKPIRWKKNNNFKMKSTLYAFGYIQCNSYIITFGGRTDYQDIDPIYILDVHSKRGWIKSPIKCPLKSRYIAVMDHQQRVHLFTCWNNNKQHYCIALKDLIPELVISSMKQEVSAKRTQQNHDDEKGGDELVESIKLRDTIGTLKAMNESLKDEVKKLKTENEAINGKVMMSKQEVVTLKKSTSDLIQKHKELQSVNQMVKGDNERLKAEVEALKKTNLEIKTVHDAKVKEMKEQMVAKEEEHSVLIENMKTENERMSDQIAVQEEEQKEAQMKIAELEDKVKEFQMRTLDPSGFMNWDWNQIHLWIMSLDGGNFQRYSSVLKEGLSAVEFTGEDLSSVNPVMIRMWGIKDKKDSKALHDHIQKLVAQNQSDHDQIAVEPPKQKEGAPTAYIGM